MRSGQDQGEGTLADILVIGRNDAESLELGWEEIRNVIEDVFFERVFAPSIETVQAFDLVPQAADGFAQLAADRGTSARVARTAPEAVADADPVVTAGAIRKDPVQELDASEVAENSVILPIDFDAAWRPKAVDGAPCSALMT
jgi:hypothetical protein